jgi:hypothetical protein
MVIQRRPARTTVGIKVWLGDDGVAGRRKSRARNAPKVD